MFEKLIHRFVVITLRLCT